jgi:hypothetical protein
MSGSADSWPPPANDLHAGGDQVQIAWLGHEQIDQQGYFAAPADVNFVACGLADRQCGGVPDRSCLQRLHRRRSRLIPGCADATGLAVLPARPPRARGAVTADDVVPGPACACRRREQVSSSDLLPRIRCLGKSPVERRIRRHQERCEGGGAVRVRRPPWQVLLAAVGCQRPRETAHGRPVKCPVAVVRVARWRSRDLPDTT